jgi:integrase
MYAELLVSGHCQRDVGLSPSTVRRIHSVVHRALGDAVRWGILSRNVAASADPPSAGSAVLAARKSRVFWTEQQLRKFLSSVREHRLYAAFRVAATTGVRRGELLGLRWEDVDLDARRLRIEQTLIAPNYKLRFSDPKTEHGRRTIELDDETVAALREHRRQQAAEQLLFGAGYQQIGLVFTQPDGSPLIPALFSNMFQTKVRHAGLPKIRLHDLRHTHAALLGKAGVPPKVIQERLGHHSAAFTLDNYGGTYPAQHREAANAIGELASPDRIVSSGARHPS